MKSIINEYLTTVGHIRREINSTPFNLNRSTDSKHYSNMTVSHCANMHGWQRDVVDDLMTNHDSYIIASPGGGKTLPVICYWAEKIMKINVSDTVSHSYQDVVFNINNFFDTSKIKKTMILVPTRTLADQTLIEYIERISEILYQTLKKYIELDLTNTNQYMMRDNLDHVTHRPVNDFIRDIYISGLSRIDNNFANKLLSLYDLRKRVFVDLFEKQKSLTNISQNNEINPNNLEDFNRLQSQIPLLKNQYENLNNEFMDLLGKSIQLVAKNLTAIRTGIRKEGDISKSLIIICIYENAPTIIKDIVNDLGLLIVDEAHKLNVNDSPSEIEASIKNCDSLYDILNEISLKNNNSVRLVFLSGTINPQTANIFKDFLNKYFRRNFKEIKQIDAKNKSNISVTINNNLLTMNGLYDEVQKIMSRPNEKGVLLLLLSRNKIDELTDFLIKNNVQKNINQIQDRYKFNPTPFYKKENRIDIDFQKLSNYTKVKHIAGNIHDPRLRNAVSSGFGFIYRVKDTDEDFEKRSGDSQIVADLFSKGFIKLLIATDAVGIGVNIGVRTILIPSIEKFGDTFQGKMIDTISKHNLSQILNRAGRAAYDIAEIQTPSKNVEYVTNALLSDPENFDLGSIYANFNKVMSDQQIIKINNTIKDYETVRTMWRNIWAGVTNVKNTVNRLLF